MRVIYSLSDSIASKLRTAADEGGIAGVLEALISAYDELYYAGIIDIDDYEAYTEEVNIVDPDDIEEAEFQLQEFFDLCDNIGIFVPVVYEEVSLEEDDSIDESFHGKWEIDTALRIAQEIGLNTLKDLRDFLKNESKPGESEFDTLLRYRAELGNDFQIKESAPLLNEGNYEEFDDVDHIDVVDIPEESDNAVKAEPCCQEPSKTVKIGENDIDIGVDFEADDIDA